MNNKGFSLVELIVVMAIMATITGILALSVSIMFSKDAESAATIIADNLTKARIYSMTKPGEFTFTIHMSADGENDSSEASYNYITIENDIAAGNDGHVSETALFKTKAIIYPKGVSSASNGTIVIKFSKTNGSVKSINDGNSYTGGDITTSDIYEIKCIAVKNENKHSTVKLMTVTGRNSVEKD